MKMRLSEILLVLSGLGIFAGLAFEYIAGSFFIWWVAKVLYGLGVALFIFDR